LWVDVVMSISPLAQLVGKLFPFHLVLDRDTSICQIGESLQRIAPDLALGDHLSEHLALQRPKIPLEFSALAENQGRLFVFKLTGAELFLRGQITVVPNTDHELLFLGSPWVDKLDVLVKHGISLSDYCAHDSAVDYLFLLQAKDAALREAAEAQERLREHRAQLEKTVASRTESLSIEVRERRAAEAALEAKSEALTRANEELSKYAHVVAHDLKSPINGIRNCVDMLVEDFADSMTSQQLQYATLLRNLAARARTLVDDLLSYSEIGGVRDEDAEIETRGFFEGLISSLPAEQRDCCVVVGDGFPRIVSNPLLLRQIFCNLICNGLKYNRTEPKRVEIGYGNSSVDRANHLFWVRDNGIGIEPAWHEKIFEIFARLHTRSEFEGTGVGLAIVEKAARELGGTVRLESQAGQGSTFFVVLPKEPTG